MHTPFLLCSTSNACSTASVSAMVVLANPALDAIPILSSPKPCACFSTVPVVDLSMPGAAEALVRACDDFGFFKIAGHGIPMELMQKLEAEALRFFHFPQADKEKTRPADPFGYGNKQIGPNGDIGWVEYLLFAVTADPSAYTYMDCSFRSALLDFMLSVRKLAREVLELMAEGLKLKKREFFSNLVLGDGSDGIFRLNHYPKFPPLEKFNCSLTGFGEHTDPQLISILRSNNSAGLQISLRDGSWVSVPPDSESFFINVGDTLQVLTNGRFKSVRHRVLANGSKPRISMIYFFGAAPTEKIAPLEELMGEGERSKYREFTWSEYKKGAYKTRLGDYRLGQFEK
ncbi:gibberellin 2-beta-dioxygenase 3-like [Zingiber officinale]|nr:gibberellin 2-beta-dioxygenase 3-like [Zingiber officinale]